MGLDSIRHNVDEFKEKQSDLDSEFDAFNQDNDIVRSLSDLGIEDIDIQQVFAGLESTYNKQENMLKDKQRQLDTERQSLLQEIDAMDSKLDEVNSKVDSLQDNQFSGSLDGVTAVVDDQKNQLSDMKAELGGEDALGGGDAVPVSKVSDYIIPKEIADVGVDQYLANLREDPNAYPVATRQEFADYNVRQYNEEKHPYATGVANGVIGLKETPNGGVSFENSPSLYRLPDNSKAIVRIKLTGKRPADFKLANEAFGFSRIPAGYTWHHLDDYDVNSGTATLQLVKTEDHQKCVPHSGSCAQYKYATGISYNQE